MFLWFTEFCDSFQCLKFDKFRDTAPLTSADFMCGLFSLNEAPPEIQVACFVGADHFKEILRDFTNKINWDNTNEVVKQCAKLAHANGYKLFAMGKNGLCLSGTDMKQKYHTYGTSGAKCSDGIGISSNSMFVYSLGKHRIFWF